MTSASIFRPFERTVAHVGVTALLGDAGGKGSFGLGLNTTTRTKRLPSEQGERESPRIECEWRNRFPKSKSRDKHIQGPCALTNAADCRPASETNSRAFPARTGAHLRPRTQVGHTIWQTLLRLWLGRLAPAFLSWLAIVPIGNRKSEAECWTTKVGKTFPRT